MGCQYRSEGVSEGNVTWTFNGAVLTGSQRAKWEREKFNFSPPKRLGEGPLRCNKTKRYEEKKKKKITQFNQCHWPLFFFFFFCFFFFAREQVLRGDLDASESRAEYSFILFHSLNCYTTSYASHCRRLRPLSDETPITLQHLFNSLHFKILRNF